MPNYTTNSEFSDLVGSMVTTGDNVDSYTSTSKGAGTVRNTGTSGLNFNVSFQGTRTYRINATANSGGNGYSGNANDNSPGGAEEPWTATATTAASATQKT